MNDKTREGGIEAPTRHPINWKTGDFNDETSLFSELERVFDVCYSCRGASVFVMHSLLYLI